MERIRDLTEVVVMMIAAILILFLVGLCSVTGLMQMLIAYAGFILVFGVLYLANYKSRIKKSTHILSYTVWIILFALATHGIADIILCLVKWLMPAEMVHYTQLAKMIDPNQSSIWLLILVTCVMTPLAEELLFRGCIMGKLRQNFPLIVALLLTTILFSAYHMNITQALYTIPFGLAAGIIYEKTGTIWASILYHAVFNGSAFIMKMNGTILIAFMLISIPLFVICFIKLSTTRRC